MDNRNKKLKTEVIKSKVKIRIASGELVFDSPNEVVESLLLDEEDEVEWFYNESEQCWIVKKRKKNNYYVSVNTQVWVEAYNKSEINSLAITEAMNQDDWNVEVLEVD